MTAFGFLRKEGFRQTFEMKLLKNGIWLTVNWLGLPAPAASP
jgi:hypothetical protein